MPRIEYRAAELRSDGRTLFGVAAPYGKPATLPGFRETIAAGAFARCLREHEDVLLCRDHDMAQVLARVGNGSLQLEDRPDGLHFRTGELPNFTAANDTLEMARAGLLAGCSIGFFVRGEDWSARRDQRTLTDVELVEISAVQSAVAYSGTSIAARSRPPPKTSSLVRLRRSLAGL
jgi:uncharacterized protein